MSKQEAFELQSGESLIKEGKGLYIKGKVSAQFGHLYLTDKRFVFVKKNLPMYLGLLGLLIQKWMGAGKVLFDIPLKDLASYKQGKHGINTKVVEFETAQGELLKFPVDSGYEDWEEALKKAWKNR